MLLTLRKPGELSKKRPPVFCRSFIPVMQGAVSMLYAGGGTGKSYTAIRIAIEFALETRQKAALWLTEDSEGENRFRFDSLVKQDYLSNEKFLNENIMFVASKPIQLTKLDGGNAVISQEYWDVRLELADFGLVVVDPLLQFNGGDENSNTHAGVLMGALKEWTEEERKSIVLIHHASKTKENGVKARGAGEWTNGCRSVFMLEKIGENGVVDQQNINNLKISLVKDNGLSYFFRDNITGEIVKNLRVFPDYIPEQPMQKQELFLSIAGHNNEKDPTGFIRCGVEDFYQIHTYVTSGKAYSQYSFREFYRKGVNNEGDATILCLDFDNGMTLDQAKNKFGKLQCCIVTTKSHQIMKSGQKCDRFRVILPLTSPLNIPLEDYPAFLNMINQITGGEVDPSTKDLARFYYSSPEDASVWYSESTKRFPWESTYSQVKRERVKSKIEKKINESKREGKNNYSGKQKNTLPKDTQFETKSGFQSFSGLRDSLSTGDKEPCKCIQGIDHGSLGQHHMSAFVKRDRNGNVFYSCSGGRCVGDGSKWCEE
jgi:hypothetical protein